MGLANPMHLSRLLDLIGVSFAQNPGVQPSRTTLSQSLTTGTQHPLAQGIWNRLLSETCADSMSAPGHPIHSCVAMHLVPICPVRSTSLTAVDRIWQPHQRIP